MGRPDRSHDEKCTPRGIPHIDIWGRSLNPNTNLTTYGLAYHTRSRPRGREGTTTRTRHFRPLPPQESRDWMTPRETALVLGCGVAMVHRLRRGLISGVEPLPCGQY